MTPAFQKFVASKLDELLELEDVEVNGSVENVQKVSDSSRGVKLTKRSRVKVVDQEKTEAQFSSRPRPSLLSHREFKVFPATRYSLVKQFKVQASTEDLAECAVTGEDVIAAKEVLRESILIFTETL